MATETSERLKINKGTENNISTHNSNYTLYLQRLLQKYATSETSDLAQVSEESKGTKYRRRFASKIRDWHVVTQSFSQYNGYIDLHLEECIKQLQLGNAEDALNHCQTADQELDTLLANMTDPIQKTIFVLTSVLHIRTSSSKQ